MTTALDAFVGLRQVIDTTPVPGAPPRLSRRGAAPGLAFLEAALSLSHVRRLTERLQIADYRNSRRVTEVDIDLDLLEIAHRTVLHAPRRNGSEARDGGDGGSPLLWLPIARISGQIPVEVRDASGARLPTMTQYETSGMLASGLYQLFRGILASHEDAKDPNSELSRFLFRLHEPRWIIQQAIVTLLTERNKPGSDYATLPGTRGTVPGINSQYRDMALRILEKYRSELTEYFELLKIAINDYLLVVGLDPAVNEHSLAYSSPLLQARPPRVTQFRQRIRAARNGYYIKYVSTVPATLGSYHLVAETPDGLDVKTMFLRTDADRAMADRVVTDMDHLADEIEKFTGDRSKSDRKILELELQNVLRRLNDLWRRRRWDAAHVGVDEIAGLTPACAQLAHVVTSGEAVETQPGHLDNSILRHPLINAQTLRKAAREIREFEVSFDLSFEQVPVARQAHAYWRRPIGRMANADQIVIESFILLVDSTSSGPRTVRAYACAVAAITYFVAVLLAGSFVPFIPFGMSGSPLAGRGSPDALVAVLLVIPGFLYSRLALPNRRSISGYIQVLPRFVSHGCIFLVAALAAAVAAEAHDGVLRLMFAIAIVLPLLGTLVLRDPSLTGSARESIAELGGPKWLVPLSGRRSRQARRPDEILYSSRSIL